MIKKYNIFISSTCDDLIEERKKVISTLIEMDCIPKSMELFYASDFSTWEFIKDILLNCDFYIVIVAGRYGSICEQTGKSFTQMEYELAVKNHIPVSRFLFKEPDNLPFNKHDKDRNKQKHLEEFREKLQNNQVVKYWSTPDELACYVAISIHHFIISDLSNNNFVNKYQKDIFEKLDRIETMLLYLNNYDKYKLFRNNNKNNIEYYNQISHSNNDTVESISKEERDMLCEISNISLTTGFNAISSLLNGIKFKNSIPKFNLYRETNCFTVKNNNQYNILLTFYGLISGKVLLTYKEKIITKIYSFFSYKYFNNMIYSHNEINESILQEISSIFVGGMLSSFSAIFNIKTQITDIYINDVKVLNNKRNYSIKIINKEYDFESSLILHYDDICKIKQIIYSDY